MLGSRGLVKLVRKNVRKGIFVVVRKNEGVYFFDLEIFVSYMVM